MRVSKRSKTGVMGVCWDKGRGKWLVRIKDVKKKTKHVGYFDDFFEAVCSRKSAEIKHKYHNNHGQNRPL